jgi:hypothetical protein
VNADRWGKLRAHWADLETLDRAQRAAWSCPAMQLCSEHARTLIRQGWRHIDFAPLHRQFLAWTPVDPLPFVCHRDAFGFWLTVCGDVWPAWPVLWRELDKVTP